MTGRSRGDSRHAPRVYVDAENVRRSVWPNIPRDELVELVNEWAEREGVHPVVVFEGKEIADDRIAREAAELDGPYWLVTSDRGLRERAAERAERVIGGGSLARELTQARSD
jgi:predicted ATP-grasp superfamily ATP-dependent carboligase